MVDFYHNKFITGNNIDVLKEVPENTFDAIITSPPYGTLRTYNGYNFDFLGLAPHLYRVLKSGGVMVWVVGDQTENGSESLIPFKQMIHFKEDIGFLVHDTMIWRKVGQGFPDNTRYSSNFEYMFVLSKGRPKTTNLLKDRVNLTAGGKIHGKERGSPSGEQVSRCGDGRIVKRFGVRFNVWQINNTGGHSTNDKLAHKHPAIFPEKLVKDHLMTWTQPGEFILDPFGGSGTTAKVCTIMNRKFCSIDISEEYTNLAKQRVEPYLRNANLMFGEPNG